MPFRFGLRPPSTSVVFGGGLQLALVRPSEPCDSPAVRARDTLEPVSAIVPIHSCSPTCSFSPRRRYQSVGARCPRSAFDPARAPPVARESDEEPGGFTPSDPPGRAFFVATWSERFRFAPAGGRSPGFFVDCGSNRSSRPLPRRPVKSAACPGPKNLSSKSAFSPAFRLSAGAASNELALARGAGALPEMAISCASHRRVTGRFRVRRHRDSARWRRPVEIPVHPPWKPELPRARFSGSDGHRRSRSAAARGRMCPSTSVTRLSNVGSRSTGAIHARHDDPCGVARPSRRFPVSSRSPLRRRRDTRAERRVVRSLRRGQRADHPPHRTWGPAEGGSFGASTSGDMRVARAESHRDVCRGEGAFRIAARCSTAR